ncbi:hypothetical protein B7486_04100 [cyanobacterium TDX16]|nr:hypothetical protein B7486_04100 [cyanobacterium TDX16]
MLRGFGGFLAPSSDSFAPAGALFALGRFPRVALGLLCCALLHPWLQAGAPTGVRTMAGWMVARGE